MADSKTDNNGIKTLLAVSNADGTTPVTLYADPVTHRLLTSAAASTPTAITVANEATDTTSFPLFVTAATGDLGPKTNAGLTFNSNTANLQSTILSSSSLTASEILITDASKNLVSAAVATYPSLTELTYVKGVTSAIQTQLGTKQATITFGTGVQTALGVNVGSAGAPVLFDGALGTPSSGVATNLTGTASGLTAGTVTTNANLTGIVTSTGNATAIADKAIAIAKLADGTDGNLITWDANGVIAVVATGNSGEVLTSNGAGAAPTFQAAAGGTDRVSFSWAFETTGRYTQAVETSGVNTFNTNGLDQTTGASGAASAYAYVAAPSGTDTVFADNPSFSALMKTAAVAGTHTSYWGIGIMIPVGASSPSFTFTANHIGFKDVSVAGTQTSSATNANGTTETATTLTAFGDATPHRISAKSTTGTNIKYYVDGTLAATHTTNMPAAGTAGRTFMVAIATDNTTSNVTHSTTNVNVGYDI